MITRFDSISLVTTDTAALALYYHRQLQIPILYDGYYGTYDGAILGFPDQGVKIIIWDQNRWQMAKGSSVLSFMVDDIDQTYQDLLAREVRIFEPPTMREWGGRSMVLYDPAGNQIVLFDQVSEFQKPATIGPPAEIYFQNNC